jgi:hypothetical protein
MEEVTLYANNEPVMTLHRNKIIAVDFDGTLCENKWPEIGEPNWDLIQYLADERRDHGAKIILWTCREGRELVDALVWCMHKGMIFDAVNENLPEIIEEFSGDCRKIFANEYIDDKMRSIFDLPYTSRSKD